MRFQKFYSKFLLYLTLLLHTLSNVSAKIRDYIKEKEEHCQSWPKQLYRNNRDIYSRLVSSTPLTSRYRRCSNLTMSQLARAAGKVATPNVVIQCTFQHGRTPTLVARAHTLAEFHAARLTASGDASALLSRRFPRQCTPSLSRPFFDRPVPFPFSRVSRAPSPSGCLPRAANHPYLFGLIRISGVSRRV